MQNSILQTAIDIPIRQLFDYLPGEQFAAVDILPGTRIRIPFGKRKEQIGLVMNTASQSDLPIRKLKNIISVIDETPLFDASYLKLLNWASQYYHHPIGDVVFTALPGLLRQGRLAEKKHAFIYVATVSGKQINLDALARAPKQKKLLQHILCSDQGLTKTALAEQYGNIQQPLQALLDKQLIEKTQAETLTRQVDTAAITLNCEQLAAVAAITDKLKTYQSCLLQGITGSGKTEVYIEVIKQVIENNKQVLILVPEIGLTPQFLQRLQRRLPVTITLVHSQLGQSLRLQNWLAARDGEAKIIIGTRSAIWTPLKNPGLLIIDEEHDLSYKQEDGFKYSARDVAIMRAQMANVPIILGSATPSLETLHNVKTKKCQVAPLLKRASNSTPPEIKMINLQNQQISGAFSQSLLQAIRANLEAGNQTLLFLNRRGYCPAILCHGCGWIAGCERCSINMTWHRQRQRLICHHCDRQQGLAPACPDCGGEQLIEVGHGTQRISETIAEQFPHANVLRIDSDSTRRRGSMEQLIKQVDSGVAQILVGTQMLAKGHHFPNITLVGIIDADNGLLGADFRATERMAQLITQVSGRAGRAKKPGTVYIQTHYPEHPLLQALIQNGYSTFSESLLAERQLAALPPYSYLALLRAESPQKNQAMQFLNLARGFLANDKERIDASGPYAAPIEKKQGRYRYQLLLQTNSRAHFKFRLDEWLKQLENSAASKKVRWSLDIDPQDML